MNDLPKLLILSRGIKAIPHGPAFLPEFGEWVIKPRSDFAAVAGWGHKPSAERARQVARRGNVPYIALEDGFLRSVRLGRDREPPLSIVVDPVGIYYDARQPSQLENWLEEGGWETPELLERARFVRQWLVDERLSKYNHLPEKCLWPNDDPDRVLVIDQTLDDMSVSGGLADAQSFADMLQAALDENPESDIVVRSHPDVRAGHRPGYLQTLPDDRRVRLLDDDVSPWSVLDGISKVYTVSSLLGFEALLAGKSVRCFGLPFYAGWGLTSDELTCPRRTRKRSLDEIFAAAYLKYARYVNPISGRACQAEEVLALLADRRRQWLQTSRPVVFYGASLWRRGFLREFIARPKSRIDHVRSPGKAVARAARMNARLACWATREPREFKNSLGGDNKPVVRVEDGFLRSVGLGSDLFRPGSLVLDDLGIYYDPRQPSRLETLLQETDFHAGLLQRAEELRQRIEALGLTKYNVGEERQLDVRNQGRKVILVPGQVEDDASITKGCRDVHSNHELLAMVRQVEPEAYIIYKPHPDVQVGSRRGYLAAEEARRFCDLFIEDVSMAQLLTTIDQVHTMTSLTGFEALLRGKQVVTYGMPFYAGWGLTKDRFDCPRRTRRLTVTELIAGALVLYPTYVDPDTRQICRAEDLLDWMAQNRTHLSRFKWKTRWIRLYQALRLRYRTRSGE